MIEIVSRQQIDTSPTTWIVAADNAGLGLEDCGCGKIADPRIVQTRGSALEVMFYHGNERCMMAFRRDGDFAPLSYEDYVALFPAVEENVDGD